MDQEIEERWAPLRNILSRADQLQATEREAFARALLEMPRQAEMHLGRDGLALHNGIASRLREADAACTKEQAAELRRRVEIAVRDWLT